MKSRWDVDRRTFLKLGAAGTALATLEPGTIAAATGTSNHLECPPTLEGMASAPLVYQFRDLFSRPVAMNEFGYAQAGK